MFNLIVDGMLSGTGVRDSDKGGYIDPDELGLSDHLKSTISEWLERYANAHFMQFKSEEEVLSLDTEGVRICKLLKLEVPDTKIEYFSHAKMKRLPIDV